MGYRTTEVDGKNYKWVVGARFTKIVSVGLYENSKIGVERPPGSGKYLVTPVIIRGLIASHRANYNKARADVESTAES